MQQSLSVTLETSYKPGRVEHTVDRTHTSNDACNDVNVFFNEYLIASFLFSMLNDNKESTYR